MILRPYSFVAQKCCVHSVLNGLFFRIDFKVTHGALSSVLLLPHLWHCLCSADTGCIKLPCFERYTSCCFCTPWPSSSAWEKGKHPMEQHSWHGGAGCSTAKQKYCPNIICWELNRGQWNDLVQLKRE